TTALSSWFLIDDSADPCEEARALCARCPALSACRAHALQFEDYGYWALIHLLGRRPPASAVGFRRRVLGGRIEERLKDLIREVVDEKGAWLVEMEVMPDHVHLLVEVDPQYGIHRLVKAIKGRSSRVLREE